MNISTVHTSAVAAAGLTGIAVFQMALAFGAPLGRAAWGGTQTELPTRLRFSSAASAVFLSVGALIVLGRGGYWSAGRAGSRPAGPALQWRRPPTPSV